MARGIMKHSATKAFLARGFLGNLLRPIIYSKTEKIHFEFLKVITKTANSIDEKVSSKRKGLLQIWFSTAPKEHFELLFIPDENNNTLIPIMGKAEVNNGKECACMTQGFFLYNLEQLIKKLPAYRKSIGMNIYNLESVCDLIFGENSKQRSYWDYFRTELKHEDPGDIPIIYVYETASIFITDSQRKKRAIQKWDDDLSGKLILIKKFENFMQNQKENSLKML